MLSKQYWSKLLLFGFLALLLGLFVGCGNNSEDFVFTTNTGNTISNPTQPTTFNLSVSTDPAVLARTLPALGRLIPITQVRIIVFNPAGTRVGEQLVAANVTAVFPLPRGQYLVRVEFLTAGNVVIGYFDRYLTLAGDAVEVIRGIRITNTPPTPNPSDPGDPFLAFTSTPDTAAEGAEFLASAQVLHRRGRTLDHRHHGGELDFQWRGTGWRCGGPGHEPDRWCHFQRFEVSD